MVYESGDPLRSVVSLAGALLASGPGGSSPRARGLADFHSLPIGRTPGRGDVFSAPGPSDLEVTKELG